MTLKGKCARKSARVIEMAKEVIDIGEVLPARKILRRMTKSCPPTLVPRNTHALAMRLRGHSSFEMLQHKDNKSKFVWRRVE